MHFAYIFIITCTFFQNSKALYIINIYFYVHSMATEQDKNANKKMKFKSERKKQL